MASACPNAAIFIYDTEPFTAKTERLATRPGGGLERTDGETFSIVTDHQLGVFEGACNECSNCETYCPEEGAPFQAKERVFSARAQFEASGSDGFFRDGDLLLARLGGQEHLLMVNTVENRASLSIPGATLKLEWEPPRVLEGEPVTSFDTSTLWRIKTVWETIYHSKRPNPVNPEGL